MKTTDTRLQGVVATDLTTLSWGGFWKCIELWVEKAVERSALFCGILEGKRVVRMR